MSIFFKCCIICLGVVLRKEKKRKGKITKEEKEKWSQLKEQVPRTAVHKSYVSKLSQTHSSSPHSVKLPDFTAEIDIFKILSK